MNEKGRIKRLFPGGNTSRGFVSFYDYIIDDAKRVFVIKGGPGVGKSTFMKNIANEILIKGYDMEFHHCSSDPDSLDGIVIPAIKVALLDGTAPHVVDPKNPGVVDEIINLGEYWDNQNLELYKEDVLNTSKDVSRLFKTAYSMLAESRVAYEEMKDYYEESIDTSKYKSKIRILKEKIFEGVVPNNNTEVKARHLFASAITPKGVYNYIESLLNDKIQVYAINGKPGLGVKSIIKSIADYADELGLYTERYHCPYEPEALDMLIIPAINKMVVNTTQPYHLDMSKMEKDIFIEETDINSCAKKDIVVKYQNEIKNAEQRYTNLLTKAIEYIFRAKSTHDVVEKYYIKAMDFNRVEEKRKEVLNKIYKYILD